MIIAQIGKTTPIKLKKAEVIPFATLVAFFKSNVKADAIVLAEDFPQNGVSLKAIRQDARFCLLPVFTLTKLTMTPLCDGFYESESFLSEKITAVAQRLKQIKVLPQDQKGRFLAYCYSRAPLDLIPHMHWSSPSYYHYPLAELFLEESAHTPSWLKGPWLILNLYVSIVKAHI